MPRNRVFAWFTLSLSLVACGLLSSTTPTATAPTMAPDSTGHEIATAQPAQRIVSLAPSNTEILFALGAGSQLVGRDSFSDYPPAAAQVADIGGGFTALNMELILSANPDLVLASPLTPPEQMADLQNIGLPIHVMPNPQTFEDLYTNLQTVARLTGREPEGLTLVATLRGREAAIIGQVSAATDKPLIYYELDATDPSAPYTSGPGTFVDLLIRTAGGENFGANLNGEWVQVSVEELLAKQPDLIVLGDNTYGGVTPEQVRARAGWQALRAVQDNRIFIFNDNLVSRPGPRLMDGLEAMAKLLHPDLVR